MDAYQTVGLPLQEGRYAHHCVTPKQLVLLKKLVNQDDEYILPGANIKIKEYCDAAYTGISLAFTKLIAIILTIYYASF